MTVDTLQWAPRFHWHVHRFDLWVLGIAFLAVAVFVASAWRKDGGGWLR